MMSSDIFLPDYSAYCYRLLTQLQDKSGHTSSYIFHSTCLDKFWINQDMLYDYKAWHI